ncbi:hypothetical protein [uncultured Tateyamaria sp.]|uniref:hypothetical protein n=1 Tax=uncultured Tateyamaria sp. TaxID=455651 RepID=UPI0026275051|nr:hypothetical protein [uncultured Tateyamaria sp.]
MTEIVAADPSAGLDLEGTLDVPLIAGRKRPNTALSPEGGSGADADDTAVEVGGDSVVEQIGEAVFRDTNDRLESEPDRAAFGSEIDGQLADNRTNGEQTAIDNTINDLDSNNRLDVEVIAVDEGTLETIATSNGDITEVYLNEGEGSRLVEVAPDEVVLIIADDLSIAETIDEAIEANVQLITEAAEENGVVVDDAGLRQALYFHSEVAVTSYFELRYFGALQTGFVDTIMNDIRTRIGMTTGEQ